MSNGKKNKANLKLGIIKRGVSYKSTEVIPREAFLSRWGWENKKT